MFYSISGKLVAKNRNFAAVEVSGIGFKISISEKTLHKLPQIGQAVYFFCYTSIRQDGVEIYGFLDESELEIFELLLSINGIGPKAGLKILEISKIESLLAAIKSGRSDLLEKAAGIGAKKAQRIVLELKDKISQLKGSQFKNGEEVELMDADSDIERALKSIGYKQNEIKDAVGNIPSKIKDPNERLKFALKFLSK